MRGIKFRAWYKARDEMFTVTSVEFDHQGNFTGVVLGAREWERVFTPDEIELVQFTGLLDRNGQEIYEGDILRMEDTIAKVVFWERPPEFGLDPVNEDEWCEDWNITDDSERMEIIGNIYETPELVEGLNVSRPD